MEPPEFYDKLLDLAGRRLTPNEFAMTFMEVVADMIEDAFAEHLRLNHQEPA